jgi:hypothetical protein
MKTPTQSPFKVFKSEILQLIAAVIFSCVILAVGYLYVESVEEQKLEVINKQSELYRDIDRLIQNETILNNSGELFDKLKVKGFYAEEDRLAWTELLKDVSEQLKLPSFRYSISPQQSISNIGSGYPSNIGLSESVMEIEADLMHEEDFLTISQELSSFAPGAFRVKECNLIREANIVTNQIKRNVGLKCSLGIYTIKPPALGGEKQ